MAFYQSTLFQIKFAYYSMGQPIERNSQHDIFILQQVFYECFA